MAQIICKIHARAKQVGIQWREGSASFYPYFLRSIHLQGFLRRRVDARKALRRVVDLCWNGQSTAVPQACYELAQAGFRLYEAIFRPEQKQYDAAQEVRRWLEQLERDKAVESLEILIDGSLDVPWNVVYGQPPDPKALL